MQSELELVKGKSATDGDDQLAVDHESLLFESAQGFHHVGEIAGEGLSGFGLEIDVVAVAKGDAAKAVPFGFILPLSSDWNLVDRLRFHGRKRRFDQKGHDFG